MTTPQLEDGYLKVANELAEAFSRFSFRGEENRIIWFVARYTYGFNRKKAKLSLSFIAKGTGLKRQNVQRALNNLYSRVILINEKDTIFINKNYDQWRYSRVSTASRVSTEKESPVSTKKANVKKTIATLGKPIREPTALQKVVDTFCQLQGIPDSQRNANYSYYTKQAKKLVEACEDPDEALEVLTTAKGWFGDKGLSWNLETVAKNLHRFPKQAAVRQLTVEEQAKLKTLRDSGYGA